MNQDPIRHLFLTRADHDQQARRKVRHFLAHTKLVRYAAPTIEEAGLMTASHPSFWRAMEGAIAKNRECTASLIAELEETGITLLSHLNDLPQGYPSKLLHTLAHMLDGFIGVDSAFYNLVEDSHWLSPALHEAITKTPEGYWLVPVVPGRLTSSLFHPQ